MCFLVAVPYIHVESIAGFGPKQLPGFAPAISNEFSWLIWDPWIEGATEGQRIVTVKCYDSKLSSHTTCLLGIPPLCFRTAGNWAKAFALLIPSICNLLPLVHLSPSPSSFHCPAVLNITIAGPTFILAFWILRGCFYVLLSCFNYVHHLSSPCNSEQVIWQLVLYKSYCMFRWRLCA